MSIEQKINDSLFVVLVYYYAIQNFGYTVD